MYKVFKKIHHILKLNHLNLILMTIELNKIC
jgi:hypothetical protein